MLILSDLELVRSRATMQMDLFFALQSMLYELQMKMMRMISENTQDSFT